MKSLRNKYNMVLWKYFGFLVILKHSVQILGKESYEVYLEEVTWEEAVKDCDKRSYEIVSFDPVPEFNVNVIPSVKREIKHYTNESWVGDYLELVKDQEQRLSPADECVELRVNDSSALNATHYRYVYLLLPTNCTKTNMIICQENITGFNINNDHGSWPGSCQLWVPPFTPYFVDGAFGFGNFTIDNNTREGFKAGKTFWTVTGNKIRCGYITSYSPAILYDDCSAKKNYVCSHNSTMENATTSPGLYAGVCLAAAVVITLTVTVIIWLRRKQFSFCKLLKANKEGKNLFRSWSSESQKSSVGLVLENNSLAYDTPEEPQPDNPIVAENPIYALPIKNSNNLQMNQAELILTHPAVASQNTTDESTRTILQTNYLTMNGSTTEEHKHASQTNYAYDSIESYPNTNSSRYKDLKTSVNDTGNNAYGMVAVSKGSVYDHTSFKSNENKIKVTETSYDHVAIDNPGAKTEKESDTGKEKTPPVPAPRTSMKSDVIYDDILT